MRPRYRSVKSSKEAHQGQLRPCRRCDGAVFYMSTPFEFPSQVPFFKMFFFSRRRRHTRLVSDWSSDVCSSDLYTFGETQLGVIYERLKYDQTSRLAADTDFKSYDRNAYAFTFVQKIGPGTLRALYGRAQDGRCALAGGGACSASGLGVRQITLGYSYTLSGQTDLYGFYTRIVNDARATYQVANAAGIGATAGADNIRAGLGVPYTFDQTF